MGPNVKFVSHICDLISERKNRGNFFIRKKTIPGVGGEGGPRVGLAKDHKKYVFFLNPSPRWDRWHIQVCSPSPSQMMAISDEGGGGGGGHLKANHCWLRRGEGSMNHPFWLTWYVNSPLPKDTASKYFGIHSPSAHLLLGERILKVWYWKPH